MRKSMTLGAILMVGALALTGCKKDKKEDKEKKADPMAATMDSMDPMGGGPRRAARRAAPRRAAAKIVVNAAYAKAVKDAAEKCKIESLTGCAELKAVNKLRDAKGSEVEILLSSIAVAGGTDVKHANVAAKSLSGYYGTRKGLDALAKEPKKLDKESVLKAFANLEKLHKYNAANAAATYGKLAGLYGLTKEFIAAAKKHKDNNKYLVYSGAKNFMAYGRLKAFPAVKALAKETGGDKWRPWAEAAVAAPRSMYKWTDDEYKAICPWAVPYLNHADIRVAASAGHLMVSCKKLDPKYIDHLLAAGKKRITEKPETWKNPIDFPYRNPCFGGFFGGLRKAVKKTAANIKGKVAGAEKKGPHETCIKTYDFLVWVTTQKKVSDDMKARAVMWISYQERNKYALKWLNKLKRSRNKKVKEEAKKQIAWLKKNYLKKK